MIRFARKAIPLALLFALLAQPNAMAATVDVDMGDNFFSPVTANVQAGDTVHWTNVGKSVHDSTGAAPLSLWASDFLFAGETFDFVFTAGGKYIYTCSIHEPDMAGTISVRIKALPRSGPVGTVFTVKVASANAVSPYVYDIQKKNPGGSWQIWKNDVIGKQATFNSTGQPTGTYQFRSRLYDTSSGGASGWSQAATIQVTA
jgi:plastocyanin